MTENNSQASIADQWGEHISAYLDGELSVEESQQVRRLLTEEPSAKRLADELRSVSDTLRTVPAPTRQGDLSSAVLAEAQRRQAQSMVELPDRLEPEGAFGLPFGGASKRWAWAGVAAAAAIMIAFYGRPETPTGGASFANNPNIQRLERSIAQMQQAAPGLRVVNFEATPQRAARLRQLLAQRARQGTAPPDVLVSAGKQSGVTLRQATTEVIRSGDAAEEVLCLDADEAELDRLLRQLEQEDEGALSRVGSDANKQPKAPSAPAANSGSAGGIRGVWRVQIAPGAGKATTLQAASNQTTPANPKRFVVLRIRLKPSP